MDLLKGVICLSFGVLFSVVLMVFGVIYLIFEQLEGLGFLFGGLLLLGIALWISISIFRKKDSVPTEVGKELEESEIKN